jgi:protein-S-isoprenylcysteine O-methyltransferase Ste14
VGNDVSPRTSTATLVTTGVYAWSRNPVYAGLIVVYFGLVLALTTVWGLLLLPFVIAVLRHAAVLPEEDYLARRFGDAYRDYARKVPRWL